MTSTASPEDARARHRAGALLIDIRGADERATGMAEGALACDPQQLASTFTDPHRELLLICESGMRSATTRRPYSA
jgi:rhodanese-related sulfurtransferase